MAKLVARLRWYPGDPLREIRQEDLAAIARECGVTLSLEQTRGKELVAEGDITREETMASPLEEITQTVVTLSAEGEPAFRQAVRLLIDRYRSPRTPYSTWGSDDRAKDIVAELADQRDGWF